MKERDNVLRIFKETKKAVEKNDFVTIKNLSDQTINTAARTQDPDNIAVAVIVYSLSKILERKNYRKYPGWNDFHRLVMVSIDKAIKDLQKNDVKKTKSDLEAIRRVISKLSGKLKKYIQDVFRRAQINKASRIYEHGVSMEKTARLLGVTMWELASYAGQTGIPDAPASKTMIAKDRIKLAEEMFG